MSQLLDRIRQLEPCAQRKVAVVLGAVVGDAAARPLHWIYDNNALQSYIREVKATPEFFPESRSPFYTLPTGENSCYADITKVSINALARSTSPSKFNYAEFCKTIAESFGKGNTFGYDMDARQDYMQKRREGRIDGPVIGKWMSGSIIQFFDNYKSGVGAQPFGGAGIKETDGFCAALPFVCRLLESDNMEDICEQVITTYSSWPTSVSHGRAACRIIKGLLETEGRFDVLGYREELKFDFPDVARSLSSVEDCISRDMDHTSAVLYVFGSPCYNPGSFQGAIHAFVTSSSYAEAIRKTIRAGGCNCSRSLFAGAMAAAKYGLDGIPEEWIEKTKDAEVVVDAAIKAFS